MDQIHEFYAVTSSSMYRVMDNEGRGPAQVMKIMFKSGNDSIPVGHKLRGGTMVGIAHSLVMYFPGGNPSFDQARPCDWGGRTSWITGLFLQEQAARECFQAQDHRLCDPRWAAQTKEVLDAIGKSHPWFSISQGQAKLPIVS